MRYRIAAAAVLVALSALAAAGAIDALRWSDAVDDVKTPSTLLPRDPVGRALGLDDDVAFAQAARAFRAAERAPQGFANRERLARARAVAAGRLGGVTAEGEARLASRAHDLLGILALGAGLAFPYLQPFGAPPGGHASLTSFQAAVRADASNTAAKENLELFLRQNAARGMRPGAGGGSGSRGGRGAGSSFPGFGY
jgi:hypothetical protein